MPISTFLVAISTQYVTLMINCWYWTFFENFPQRWIMISKGDRACAVWIYGLYTKGWGTLPCPNHSNTFVKLRERNRPKRAVRQTSSRFFFLLIYIYMYIQHWVVGITLTLPYIICIWRLDENGEEELRFSLLHF